MPKNKEFITFAQQRHNEYLYNVFTVFFITGCFLPVSQAAFGSCADLFFGSAPESTVLIAIKMLMTAIYSGVGIYLPFLIYNIIVNKNSGRYFTKPAKKTSAPIAILAVLAISGIGIFIQYLSGLLAQVLRESGLLFREALPNVGDNIVLNILFILCNALIPVFFQEITFRGIVIHNAKKDSHIAAIIISTLLGSLTYTSIQQAPHLLVTGFLLGWLYLKTDNLYLTFICNAVMNGFLATKWVLTCTVGKPFVQNIPLYSLLFGGIGLISFGTLLTRLKCKTQHAPTDCPLCRKDTAKALFKPFALWLFILICVFRVLFGYIAGTV